MLMSAPNDIDLLQNLRMARTLLGRLEPVTGATYVHPAFAAAARGEKPSCAILFQGIIIEEFHGFRYNPEFSHRFKVRTFVLKHETDHTVAAEFELEF
jgi:hypothetical protein